MAASRTISGTYSEVRAPSRRADSWSISGSSSTESTRSLRRRSRTRIVFERCASWSPTFVSPSSPAAASIRAEDPCGSAIVTVRASSRSRSRVAISWSSRPRSNSVTRTFITSFSDSSCADQRVADSYRRAFSIATAAWEPSMTTASSSSSVKSAPPAFSVR